MLLFVFFFIHSIYVNKHIYRLLEKKKNKKNTILKLKSHRLVLIIEPVKNVILVVNYHTIL